MARKVPDIIFRMADLFIERIVAELVDNSLDAKAKTVHVHFFDVNKEKGDIGLSVFDNGNGFTSVEDLFDSMEIEVKDNEKETGDIGKYHIGMKLAPLSKYENLYVVSIIEGKTWVCRAFNAVKTNKPFDMDDKANVNPTKPFPYSRKDKSIPDSVHEQLKQGGFAKPKGCKWTTCVIAEKKWRNLLEDGFDAAKFMLEDKKYPKHMAQYLGLTYQLYLEEDEELEMKVGFNQDVEPYDPFWTQYTPTRIDEIVKDLGRKLSKSENKKETTKLVNMINAGNAMKKFGTFRGKKYVSSVLEGLEVTPYVLPVSKAKTKIRNNIGEGWGDKTPAWPGAVSSSGSNLLRSDEVGGLYFYRGKRLISCGLFYDLNVTDNSANSIRIKIRFSEEHDDHMEVHPNKHKMDSFSDESWEEIMTGLGLKSGSSDYAVPFNQNVPFFDPEHKSHPKKPKKGAAFKPSKYAHYPNILVRNDKDFLKYINCQECDFLHEAGDLCPQAECSVCHLKGKGCKTGSCKSPCSHCPKVGVHASEDCPKLCGKCKVDHKGEECPKACEKCGSSEDPCDCPCDVCEEKQPCSGCCKKCKKINVDCTCDQKESGYTPKGPKQTLILWAKNKSKNIKYIKQAMNALGITVKDLE